MATNTNNPDGLYSETVSKRFTAKGLYGQTVLGEVSASPTVTNLYYNGVLIDSNFTVVAGVTGQVLILGTNFNLIDGLLLSASNQSIFTSLTSIYVQGKDPGTITGQLLNNYVVRKNNSLIFNLPFLYPTLANPNVTLTFVPFNKAGQGNTTATYIEDGVTYQTLIV